MLHLLWWVLYSQFNPQTFCLCLTETVIGENSFRIYEEKDLMGVENATQVSCCNNVAKRQPQPVQCVALNTQQT